LLNEQEDSLHLVYYSKDELLSEFFKFRELLRARTESNQNTLFESKESFSGLFLEIQYSHSRLVAHRPKAWGLGTLDIARSQLEKRIVAEAPWARIAGRVELELCRAGLGNLGMGDVFVERFLVLFLEVEDSIVGDKFGMVEIVVWVELGYEFQIDLVGNKLDSVTSN